MADEKEKVYYPETILDNPLPQQAVEDYAVSQSTSNDTTKPAVIKDNLLPFKKIATELLSQALNTRSKRILQQFQFTPSGAIQIGEFQLGVSGDVKISPNGIVARDLSGQTTVAIDGETGDAAFSGTIQGRSLVTGELAVGGDAIVLDGDGERITMTDGNGDVRVLIGDDGT